jgi:hypothetical protein
MVSPALWRAVCPLATLNMLGNRSAVRRLSGGLSRISGLGGIALLALLVPARLLAFNEHAWALLALLVLAAAFALASGFVFRSKSGFCNTLCPVLPVERLYGQRPLLRAGNPRCAVCDLCTPRGCIDLAAEKSVAQILGPSRRHSAWLATAYGAFAASFPGFVVGYFTAASSGMGSSAAATVMHVLAIYGYVLGCAAASYAVVTAIVLTTAVRSTLVLPALGALSAALYYWFAVPTVLETLGAGVAAVETTRVVMLAVVGAWGVRAMRRSPASMDAPVPQTS